VELYQNILFNIDPVQTSTFKRARLRKGGKALRRHHSGQRLELEFVQHPPKIKLNEMVLHDIFQETHMAQEPS